MITSYFELDELSTVLVILDSTETSLELVVTGEEVGAKDDESFPPHPAIPANIANNVVGIIIYSGEIYG